MTEKEAREALTETIRDALIDYADSGEHVAPETFSDGPEIGAAIDALLVARTEAIAQTLDAFAEEYSVMTERGCFSDKTKSAAMVAYSAVSIAAVKVRNQLPDDGDKS